MTPLDVAEFERWRRVAEDTLDSARVQAGAGSPPWACFLSEQAAQMAIKALLHGIGVDARGHDLVALTSRLGDALDEPLDDFQPAARRLARYYIPTRYPDALPGGVPTDHYVAAEAASAVEQATSIIAQVDRWWADLAAEAS